MSPPACRRPWVRHRWHLLRHALSQKIMHPTSAAAGYCWFPAHPRGHRTTRTAHCTNICAGRLDDSCRPIAHRLSRRARNPTGRPYVLLVFGTTSPTPSARGDQHDYSSFRKVSDTRMTFFHIWSSLPENPLQRRAAPPATVLPTLLSRCDQRAGRCLSRHQPLAAALAVDAVHRISARS
jgi:hypothetical protein